MNAMQMQSYFFEDIELGMEASHLPRPSVKPISTDLRALPAIKTPSTSITTMPLVPSSRSALPTAC